MNYSQQEAILEHLQSGHCITALEAQQYFDCHRLSARIFDLKKAGNNIVSEHIKDKNTGKRYAKYQLVQERIMANEKNKEQDASNNGWTSAEIEFLKKQYEIQQRLINK